jgi:hypothetical protein
VSIWSSFADIEPLRDSQYGDNIVPDSWLDLADTGLRGPRGGLLRIIVDDGDHDPGVVLDRRQATLLRDHLTQWLRRTETRSTA